MKISRRNLRRIIEAIDNNVNERFGRAGPADAEDRLRRSIIGFADEYMMGMEMTPSNPADVQRTKLKILDVATSVLGESTDHADKLQNENIDHDMDPIDVGIMALADKITREIDTRMRQLVRYRWQEDPELTEKINSMLDHLKSRAPGTIA